MKIYEDVYKIPGNGNVYLVLKPVPTIIDTSDQIDSQYIKSEIEKIIPIEKIENVLLTHLHYDHAGNVELFSNAQIYADIKEIIDYKKNSNNFFFGSVPKNIDNILKKKLKSLPTKINGLEIIKVPGHSRGSIAFLDKKRKLLFSGDTLFFKGIIGRIDLPNSVPEKMDESVTKLINEIKNNKLLLYPGHDY